MSLQPRIHRDRREELANTSQQHKHSNHNVDDPTITQSALKDHNRQRSHVGTLVQDIREIHDRKGLWYVVVFVWDRALVLELVHGLARGLQQCVLLNVEAPAVSLEMEG